MSKSKSSCLVLPVTKDDLDAIAQLSGAGFEDDRHTQLKVATGGYDHQKATLDALTHFMKFPESYFLMKAVDSATNEIMGFICWASIKNKPEEKKEEEEGQEADEEAATEKEDQEQEESRENAEEITADAGEDGRPKTPILTPIQQLEAITNADMRRWQGILMPKGTECWIIVMITIAPQYQGKGAGTALIEWGTSQADEESLFCWVHSSEAGYRMFEKRGFEIVGTLEVNLDDYAVKGPEDGEKWGNYTFRYMKRLPKESGT